MKTCFARYSLGDVQRIVAAMVLLTSIGCGQKYPSSVCGRVTLDGKPLSNGTVAFHPHDRGLPVLGQIDSSGWYFLKTGTSASLQPGEYDATVQSLNGTPKDRMTPSEMDALSNIPRHYGSTRTSGLHFQIVGGKNVVDIALSAGTATR